MKTRLPKRNAAWTLIELLLVIAVLMVVAILMFPAPHGNKAQAAQIACANNLMCVGASFRVSSQDASDRWSMKISTNYGGTMEYVGTPETFRHFQVISNELNTPKILVCPTDRERRPAAGFVSNFGNTNVSYFVGVDAEEVYPRMFLSGDRNLANGTPAANHLLALTTNQPGGWTGQMHVERGHILLADGSVQFLSTLALRQSVRDSEVATNRLALP